MSGVRKLLGHFFGPTPRQAAERQRLVKDMIDAVENIRRGMQRVHDEQVAIEQTFRDIRSVLNVALAEIERGRPHNARTILAALLGRES